MSIAAVPGTDTEPNAITTNFCADQASQAVFDAVRVPVAAWRPGFAVRCAAVALCAALAACANLPSQLKPGDSAAAVRQRLGSPTGEHPAPDGGRKLEFATGPFGKATYMVVFDAQDRMTGWENVLNEAQFNRIVAGITAEALRQQLGRPSRVWAVRYHDQTVWSYRYETSFCQLFHVGITPQGVVEDTSYGPDPMCDRDRRGPGG